MEKTTSLKSLSSTSTILPSANLTNTVDASNPVSKLNLISNLFSLTEPSTISKSVIDGFPVPVNWLSLSLSGWFGKIFTNELDKSLLSGRENSPNSFNTDCKSVLLLSSPIAILIYLTHELFLPILLFFQ